MIKARKLDQRNMQTNGVVGGANGISFGNPKKTPKLDCKVLLK